MAGDIDESEAKFVAVRGGEFEVGESDVDRDAAPLLFFQAVGIDSRQGLYERSFPMVDVAGRADDDGLHWEQYSRGGRTLLLDI